MSKNIFLTVFALIFVSSLAFAASEKRDKFTYDSKGKRDPFFQTDTAPQVEEPGQKTAPAMTPKEKLAKRGIVVSSIMWDKKKPAILINDEILEEGDTVQGVIIRTIEKDYVVFEIEGELVEVPVA